MIYRDMLLQAAEAASGRTPERPSAVPPYRSPSAGVEDLLRQNISATLAAGMIAAGGKAVSAAEAVGVFREVREALDNER